MRRFGRTPDNAASCRKTHDVTYRNMTPNSVQGWNTSYGFLPFQRVINAFAGDPQVTSGKMMGSVGLKVNGRIFAMLVKGKCRGIEMLLKLENPVWHRIQQLTVRGERVGNGQAVDAALSASRRSPPNVGTDRRVVGIGAVAALEQYVRAQKTVQKRHAGVDGRSARIRVT
jgi:hypothetical protein